MDEVELAAFQTWYLSWLQTRGGFKDPKILSTGKWAAVYPYMFTYAICTGTVGDIQTYEDRWCYSSFDKAKAALDAWDGTGEPTGWHRHPASGRRVDEEGKEYIAL